METYKEIQKRHQEEFNAFDGLFFAFSNQKLKEGLSKVGLKEDDTKAIVSIGGGGYLRKDKIEAFKDMFARHEREKKEARKALKDIKIKFVGIDSWNRPIFKSIEKPYRFYGTINDLFGYDETEEKVLSMIDEDSLSFILAITSGANRWGVFLERLKSYQQLKELNHENTKNQS